MSSWVKFSGMFKVGVKVTLEVLFGVETRGRAPFLMIGVLGAEYGGV
jgi:hypothetical protein